MAVEMRDRFVALAAEWRHRGYELGFGVGIAVGHATLGRIGFEGRHDYGAIGNVTILASRLSSRAQAGQILLGPRVSALLGGRAELEPVGELAWNVIAMPAADGLVSELVPDGA
jgi:class 3 adenylate cyclase